LIKIGATSTSDEWIATQGTIGLRRKGRLDCDARDDATESWSWYQKLKNTSKYKLAAGLKRGVIAICVMPFVLFFKREIYRTH
jgi:hypothetical protein